MLPHSHPYHSSDGSSPHARRGTVGVVTVRHEVPWLVEYRLYVLSLAGQLSLVVRVSENPAISKDDVLADLGDLCLYFYLLAHFDHI